MIDAGQRLLPPNATPQEIALELTMARLAAPDESIIKTLWNPDLCPANRLPWLAWALSVDVWSSDWSEAQKRTVIRQSVPMHRIKGTRGAIELALQAVDFEVSVQEWFEYGGSPYTFRADVSVFDMPITQDDIALMRSMIDAAKNVRSHYALSVTTSTRAAPQVGLGLCVGVDLTVYQLQVDALTERLDIDLGIGMQSGIDLTVYERAA